jgi:hypothetical protein
MKLIIAGSRTWWPTVEVIAAVTEHLHLYPTEVVCGMAPGADMAGYNWAKTVGVPIKEMPANWERFGKKAGPLRNQEMGLYADGALVFWDESSPGSANMYAWMGVLGKPHQIFTKEKIRVILGNPQAVVHAGPEARGLANCWSER